MTTIRQTRWAIPALALLLVAGVPRDASAFWGIFERLSGPGPFWGYQFTFDHILCALKAGDGGEAGFAHIDGRDANADNIECMADGNRIRAHFSVEFSDVRSGADERFPNAVTWRGIRPMLFYRLYEWVDLGAGIGANRFSGTGFAFWRVSLPLRVRFFAPGLESRSRWRAIYLGVQGEYLPGKFTTADFLAPPGPDMTAEVVPSVFLGVDVLRLFTGH